MAAVDSPHLLDYIFIVGPTTEEGRGPTAGSPISPSSTKLPPADWHNVRQAKPGIIWRHPLNDIPQRPLPSNITYFCQPEEDGCPPDSVSPISTASSSHLSSLDSNASTTTHYFMLTNTETNIRTYGVCVTFPYLTDNLLRAQSPNWVSRSESESLVGIQEWGLLSVCILSLQDNYQFFEKVLHTFIHFVDLYCGDKLSWELLIRSHFHPSSSDMTAPIKEVTDWVESLVVLPVPRRGIELMEVELEVDPAVLVGYPPSSRLPFVDLPIHYVLQRLDIHLVIEIYKLLLLEHKVIIHSQDYAFASRCVITILSLLYPLQYLFPVIPLLPTSLPSAENLLLVPTPFFIGVPSSFVKKINMTHRMETWIVDLDNRKLESPIHQDIDLLEKFPVTLLQLQADLRQALDKMEEVEKSSHSIADLTRLKDETDVLIRVAFIEFLLGPEMLGCIDNHLTIYRLFPRPVVDLRLESFLAAYVKKTKIRDIEFISNFIKSQSVEYFMEWVLNPSNKAFEEIRKGFCEIERIGDKLCWWVDKVSPARLQYTLYQPDCDESVLYQEMLHHKAWQIPTNNTMSRNYFSSDDESDESDDEEGANHYRHDGTDISYDSDVSSDSAIRGCVAPEMKDIAIDIHPSITITCSTPSPVAVGAGSSNEVYLSLVKTPSKFDHVPLPPENKQPVLSDPVLRSDPLIMPDSVISFDPGMLPDFDLMHEPLTPDHISALTLDSDPLSKVNRDSANTGVEMNGVFEPPTDSATDNVSLLTSPINVADSHNSTDSSYNLSMTLSPLPIHRHFSGHKTKRRHSSPSSPEPETGGLPRVGSWMNLRGPLIEMMQFSSGGSAGTEQESPTVKDPKKHSSSNVVRSVPWSAVSSLHELETQIKDIVCRVGAGQGLPWPKSVALKTIASEERSRVALLRLLELRLGIRQQNNLLLSANGEIVPIIVSRAVYKGVLDLLKYIIQPIEASLQADIDTPIFSLFLVLRLALCLCTDLSRKRSPLKSTENELNGHRTPSPLPPPSPNLRTRRSLPTSSSSSLPLKDLSYPGAVDDNSNGFKVAESNLSVSDDRKRVRAYDPVLLGGDSERETEHVEDHELQYLHVDLLRAFSSAMKGIVVRRQFWNSLFSAVVQADRKYLGWNEKTSELYDRYNSLPCSSRLNFGYEEDTLLSIVLHNVLVFLLMIGISPKETMDVCHRISARTRLATAEEKLLQETMSELENADSNGVNIKNLAVLALFSERHPIITYVVHHGISVTAPIFKLQVTDEVCILRRFPDERITCRFWNDHILNIDIDESRLTISFLYKEGSSEYWQHFHSKQYHEIYQCLQVMVYKSKTN
ncbi:PREDICTED: MAP kinase-activating death domain protein-like [Amphimedon queenslandica]|uniref:MAP kinase-activating death domain protein n=1 Tax=Amphimedon queenslandica TaxID=400682 RepID=A0A1X7UI51_AMPQE|nr:PREDICTED: MAP kinase-activating death domain protein-like [Amphimedon queenslandica]|eukprot:XP_011405011.1 PREDICTED: MAP kinase-activating death domain protein-like [Amphimedon queenslandica]